MNEWNAIRWNKQVRSRQVVCSLAQWGRHLDCWNPIVNAVLKVCWAFSTQSNTQINLSMTAHRRNIFYYYCLPYVRNKDEDVCRAYHLFLLKKTTSKQAADWILSDCQRVALCAICARAAVAQGWFPAKGFHGVWSGGAAVSSVSSCDWRLTSVSFVSSFGCPRPTSELFALFAPNTAAHKLRGQCTIYIFETNCVWRSHVFFSRKASDLVSSLSVDIELFLSIPLCTNLEQRLSSALVHWNSCPPTITTSEKQSPLWWINPLQLEKMHKQIAERRSELMWTFCSTGSNHWIHRVAFSYVRVCPAVMMWIKESLLASSHRRRPTVSTCMFCSCYCEQSYIPCLSEC